MNILRRIVLKPFPLNTSLNLYRHATVGGLWEPVYLEALKSKFPLYDIININLKGYDYAILENYQKIIHNMIRNMDINVEECWSLPPQQLQVSTYKPNSSIVNAQYNLKLYQRTVQITDITSIQLPIVLRVIETSLPAGVSVEIRPHEETDEEIRYIPDSELNALKQELDELGGPVKTRR